MGIFEWNAMSKGIGTTPDNAQRTQSCLIKDLKCIQLRVDCLSPFNVQDDRQYIFLYTVQEFVNCTYNFNLSLRLCLKLEEMGNDCKCILLCHSGIDSREGT